MTGLEIGRVALRAREGKLLRARYCLKDLELQAQKLSPCLILPLLRGAMAWAAL